MLRLASYNVHGFVGADGERNVARVAEEIRNLDVDAVGLQEVPFETTRDGGHAPCGLLELLPGYHGVYAPIERHDGYCHGNALLTRLPIARSQSISLSYHQREPRTALEVELLTDTGRCRIITTHLGLNPGERRFQVKALLEHVAREPEQVTVLLGDFNEWFLMGRPLRWLEGYFGPGRRLSTFPARFPLFALDRIWVHPRERLTSCRVMQSAALRSASDHLPLLAEINLPAREQAAH